ncbi:uncharacterized protein LOC127810304 [Diospyros lotus]|uniref:uncharacterized protein LOC127810304 n=1 Tax=Diospyros lotus TaxID=55363 RepID=UPI00224DBD99|nr:uncharacterized protein LOC127810304 [Diospyros lotus]
MAHVSDIKLIRTDTTLDLSQKAEKGMPSIMLPSSFLFIQFSLLLFRFPDVGRMNHCCCNETQKTTMWEALLAAWTVEEGRLMPTIYLPNPSNCWWHGRNQTQHQDTTRRGDQACQTSFCVLKIITKRFLTCRSSRGRKMFGAKFSIVLTFNHFHF